MCLQLYLDETLNEILNEREIKSGYYLSDGESTPVESQSNGYVPVPQQHHVSIQPAPTRAQPTTTAVGTIPIVDIPRRSGLRRNATTTTETKPTDTKIENDDDDDYEDLALDWNCMRLLIQSN